MNTCSFYLALRTDRVSKKTGLAPFCLHATINGESFKVGLERSILPVYWDAIGKRINDKKFNDVQHFLNNKLAKAHRIFERYDRIGRFLSKKEFLNEFLTEKNILSFTAFMKEKMDARLNNNSITQSTYKQNKVVLNSLLQWKKDGLMFNELNEKNLNEYRNWMKSNIEKKLKLKSMVPVNGSVNATSKALSTIRTYVRLAIAEGFQMFDPFSTKTIRMPRKDGELISLKPFELIQLMETFEKRVLAPQKQEVLRAFLFQCHTGLRISDVLKFNKHSDIENEQIKIIPYKTRRYGYRITVPLSDRAKNYLPEGDTFIQISDTRYNELLKILAMDTGIKTKLSSHVGRHTFGTLFMMAPNAKLHVLKELMGHSNIKTTQVYVKASIEYKKEQMDGFGSFVQSLMDK